MRLSSIAFRNIFRNGRRSILSIIAIAVAAIAITFLFALLEGLAVDIRHNAWNYESGEIRIRNLNYDRYEHLQPVQYVVPEYRSLSKRLQEMPGVAAVSPRIRVPSAHFKGERRFGAVGYGLDLTLESQYQDLQSIIAEGRLPAPGSNEALLGFQLAQELGVATGDMVTFLTQTRQRGSNAFSVDVVGLANFPVGGLNKRVMILPIDSAARYMRMDGAASEILIKSSQDEAQALTDQINTLLAAEGADQLQARHWSEISAGYGYLVMANSVYRIIALVFFFLASTVIISTTMMAVHERTREIGTLAALGMSDRRLVRLFFLEASMLGAFGALLGVLIGSGIVLPLSSIGLNLGYAVESLDMDISNVVYPRLNLNSTLLVFVFALAVSMVSTYPSTRRAAKMQPVEALRTE